MWSPTSVQRVRPGNITRAAETLASAYLGNPWVDWVVPEHERFERVRELQRLHLEHTIEYGVAYFTPGEERGSVQAVISFTPSDAPDPCPEMVERILELHGEYVPRLHTGLPAWEDPDLWVLETLGVEGDHKSQGVGSSLLSHGLQKMNEIGASVVLTTSDERNVRFYGRYGFEVEGHVEIPDGPEVWAMLRQA